MQFLTGLFGGSENTILTAGLALGIVLVLIVLGVWLLKLAFKATNTVARGRNRRLAVVDTMQIDAKRQLLIVRRDNVEHLILTGGPQDMVVESGIPVIAQAGVARRGGVGEPMVRVPPQKPETETEVARPSEPAGATAMDRLRALGRGTGERTAPRSLRHTGLMRPVSRMEPGVIPFNGDNSLADSATSGPTGEANGQAKGGDISIGRNRDDGFKVEGN